MGAPRYGDQVPNLPTHLLARQTRLHEVMGSPRPLHTTPYSHPCLSSIPGAPWGRDVGVCVCVCVCVVVVVVASVMSVKVLCRQLAWADPGKHPAVAHPGCTKIRKSHGLAARPEPTRHGTFAPGLRHPFPF